MDLNHIVGFDDPYPWLEGERVSEFLSRVVAKCPAKDGDGFEAVKVSHMTGFPESEANMLKYAVEHAGVKAPKLRRVEIVGDARLMVTDFVPGVPLDTVWSTMNKTDKAGIKQQLQEQIALFRNCSIPYIGRIGDDATFPDPYRPLREYFIGPFEDESAFDNHKVQEFERQASEPLTKRLKARLDALRGTDSKRFVLTHGDLNSRNIHVECIDGIWQISGILDWERSGFFPEYMEYAIAMRSSSHDWQWRHVLKEVLQGIGVGCSNERVKVEDIATERIFPFEREIFPYEVYACFHWVHSAYVYVSRCITQLVAAGWPPSYHRDT